MSVCAICGWTPMRSGELKPVDYRVDPGAGPIPGGYIGLDTTWLVLVPWLTEHRAGTAPLVLESRRAWVCEECAQSVAESWGLTRRAEGGGR